MIDYRSYIGDSIYHTEQARYNSAVAWYRSILNLGFPKTDEIIRYARFIRYGVLSSSEASSLFYGRMRSDKMKRFLLMVYYIEDGWVPEQDFYFKPIESLWHDMEVVENTTLFP